MQAEILMIGKVQEKPYRTLLDGYLARCQKRISVDIVPCRDDAEQIKRTEGKEWIVALDERGKALDSMGFAQWLSGHIHSGRRRLTFCLGGAAGLPETIKKGAQERLSLSSLTLNHQLALLVLGEQLYRGLSILFGEPYHKP